MELCHRAITPIYYPGHWPFIGLPHLTSPDLVYKGLLLDVPPGWHAEKGGVGAPTGGTTFVRGAEGGSMASGRYPHPDSEMKRWCVWCQIMKSPINHKFHLWGICQRNVHFPHILVIKMGCKLPKPVIHHPGVFHFQLGHPERKTFISYCYFEGQFAQLQTLTKRWRCFRPANSPLFKNWRKLPTLQNVRLLSPGSTNKSIGKLPALWMISFKTNLRCELMTPWDPWKVGKAF